MVNTRWNSSSYITFMMAGNLQKLKYKKRKIYNLNQQQAKYTSHWTTEQRSFNWVSQVITATHEVNSNVNVRTTLSHSLPDLKLLLCIMSNMENNSYGHFHSKNLTFESGYVCTLRS